MNEGVYFIAMGLLYGFFQLIFTCVSCSNIYILVREINEQQ